MQLSAEQAEQAEQEEEEEEKIAHFARTGQKNTECQASRVLSRRKMDKGRKKRSNTGERVHRARKKERESAAPLILPSVSLCRTIVLE